MRALAFFLFALLLTPVFSAPAALPVANSDVLVVLKIDGLTDPMLSKLVQQIGKQQNYSLEYSCVWSDVVVLRMSDVLAAERGDAITITRRFLSTAGIDKGVEFLHVHMEAQGMNKC